MKAPRVLRAHVCTRAKDRVLCGNGTRIRGNRVNCSRTVGGGVNRASFDRFYRSKSRFLSKMIKYGAYEMNRLLNSIRE